MCPASVRGAVVTAKETKIVLGIVCGFACGYLLSGDAMLWTGARGQSRVVVVVGLTILELTLSRTDFKQSRPLWDKHFSVDSNAIDDTHHSAKQTMAFAQRPQGGSIGIHALCLQRRRSRRVRKAQLPDCG